MKLSEIVIEQQLDELDLAGAAAKGLGAVAKGAGALAGVPGGMADQFRAGKQAARDAIAGRKITPGSAGTTPDGLPSEQDANVQGTLNVQQLAKLMPGIDAAALAKAVAVVKAGGEPSVSQQQALSSAFVGLLQADPQATTQAMSLLKKVSSEPAQEKPASTPTPAGQAAPAKTDPAAQARINAAPQGYDGETGKPNAAPEPGKTTPAAPQTPDQIRAAKQADAAKTAQDQMAANPAAPKPEAPAADPGAAAFGNMAKTLTQEPKAAPTATTAAPAADATQPTTGGKLTPAQQAAMKAKLQGQRQAGKTAGTTASGFNKYTKDASSQRIVGANPDGSPKIQTIKAGKINTGNNLSEMLAANIAKQKKKIAEERTANYENSSIFTK